MRREKKRFFSACMSLMLTVAVFAGLLSPVKAFAAADSPDALFYSSSFDFNYELAKLSLDLSASAYGETADNAEAKLSSLGFENDMRYDSDSYKKSAAQGANSAGYSLASKKIQADDKTYDLVAVVIKGTSSDNEWISNMNINNSGTSSSVHEGFYKAEKELLASLESYTSSMNADPARTKLLITGHSRGAAVANLLAANLMSSGHLASPSNIYTYTFATPNVAKIGTQNFMNIFNAVDDVDIVTHIPFTAWGYDKYGVNYTMTDLASVNQTNLAATNKLVSGFTSLAPTVEDFYRTNLTAAFLSGKQVPKASMDAHNIQSYADWLNAADNDALCKQIIDLQFKLIPDTNYA